MAFLYLPSSGLYRRDPFCPLDYRNSASRPSWLHGNGSMTSDERLPVSLSLDSVMPAYLAAGLCRNGADTSHLACLGFACSLCSLSRPNIEDGLS